MSGYERMDALLRANGCDWDTALTRMHRLMLQWGLQQLCHGMDRDSRMRSGVLAIYRKRDDDVQAARVVVRTYLGTELPEQDAVWFNRCLLAYFRKTPGRTPVLPEQRRRQLTAQGGVCVCCGRPITLETGEYDHVIPWELVGEMEDNGQMLCPDCNREKANSVEFMAKRLLFKPVHKG